MGEKATTTTPFIKHTLAYKTSRARSADPPSTVMADTSVPSSAPLIIRRKKKKTVLIPFAGKSQLESNRQLFEWSAVHLFEPGDNVFVFHFHRASTFAVPRLSIGASPTPGAGLPQRPGFTVVNIDSPPAKAEAKEEEKEVEVPAESKVSTPDAAALQETAFEVQKSETGVDAGTQTPVGAAHTSGSEAGEVEWLPRAVSDALRKHRAEYPSSVAVVFQIDSAAGPTSPEVREPQGQEHSSLPKPSLLSFRP